MGNLFQEFLFFSKWVVKYNQSHHQHLIVIVLNWVFISQAVSDQLQGVGCIITVHSLICYRSQIPEVPSQLTVVHCTKSSLQRALADLCVMLKVQHYVGIFTLKVIGRVQ